MIRGPPVRPQFNPLPTATTACLGKHHSYSLVPFRSRQLPPAHTKDLRVIETGQEIEQGRCRPVRGGSSRIRGPVDRHTWDRLLSHIRKFNGVDVRRDRAGQRDFNGICWSGNDHSHQRPQYKSPCERLSNPVCPRTCRIRTRHVTLRSSIGENSHHFVLACVSYLDSV